MDRPVGWNDATIGCINQSKEITASEELESRCRTNAMAGSRACMTGQSKATSLDRALPRPTRLSIYSIFYTIERGNVPGGICEAPSHLGS